MLVKVFLNQFNLMFIFVKGYRILEELSPDIGDELIQAGALPID